MRRILLEYPGPLQTLRDIPPEAKFTTSVTLLWDEQTDGPLPAVVTGANLGGIIRTGSVLSVDAAKLTAAKAAAQAKIDAETTKTDAVRANRLVVKAIRNASNVVELKAGIIAGFKVLGLDVD